MDTATRQKAFKDLNISDKMYRVTRRLAKKIERQIKDQVPVDTGALKDSIEVEILPTADGLGIEIVLIDLDYGKYTDFGTGPYYEEPNELPMVGIFRGYERGQGGIRPQYWSSLDPDIFTRFLDTSARVAEENIANLIEDNIAI